MKLSITLLAFAGFIIFSNKCIAQSAPPPIVIVLKPHGIENTVDYIDVAIHLGAPDVGAGRTLVHLPLTIVSRPGIQLEAKDLKATDVEGVLPLGQSDMFATSSSTYRNYIPARATLGDVTLEYRAHVNASKRNGPLFDLVGQPGGVNGAGVTFLALPDTNNVYAIDVQWDLSALAAGSRGISSLGEGEVKLVGPPEAALYMFYYAGAVKSYTLASSRFTVYWMTEPPFNVQAFAASIGQIYKEETSFFKGSAPAYNIFIRQNSFLGLGGTALSHGFMLGYSRTGDENALAYRMLVSHEMIHNWPALSGDHIDTAWYSEGTAEYYSLLLSLRAHTNSMDETIEGLNSRVSAYLGNPLHTLNNRRVGEQFWKDLRAQTVPYGRGLLYLIHTNARIVQATAGQKSVDDVVLWVLNQQRAGKEIGNAEWVERVGSLIGAEAAKKDYEAMVAGSLDRVDPKAFSPCLVSVPAQIHEYDLGFDPQSFDSHRITGLNLSSAAAKAGLEEGDTIIDTSDTYRARMGQTNHLVLTVERGQNTLKIDYIPRSSQAISAFKWQLAPDITTANCSL
ncbi:hypothetical protein [Granulicella mallensis]|uniref:Peptidase M61 domain protein n=1 Tax=Granulicella mallensis TaxID=940614 RepID=A0A7W7ZMG3_9BACT|nr:hypothetical protein [Granulicella mallensis]MBB5062655.1 hypothetical protein [Granulicella mallensis]